MLNRFIEDQNLILKHWVNSYKNHIKELHWKITFMTAYINGKKSWNKLIYITELIESIFHFILVLCKILINYIN